MYSSTYVENCLVSSRFLTFDPYDYEAPFSVEVFKLPSSCACYSPQYSLPEPRRRKKKDSGSKKTSYGGGYEQQR